MPKLDLNDSDFQKDWFSLEKSDQLAVLKTLRKLLPLTWDQVYKDSGLNWELAREVHGERFYSIRITQKCRALVRRNNDFVIFVSLHPDHDSAY
jgi:hypothetical protein